jgi:hypothetical protein
MNSKNLIRLRAFFVAIATICMSFLLFVSCEDEEKNGKGVDYDPSKPVVLTSFHPDSGGIASKVIFDGENFGSDPGKIKVYFNSKPASVVGSTGSRMYAVVPRTPGDTCTVSVVVGNDSTVYDHKFRYKISVSVSTIAGNGVSNVLKVGALDQATFQPRALCLDNDGNLFSMIHNSNGGFLRINEEENAVYELANSSQGIVWTGAPCVDMSTGIITFPSDHVRELFWTFDPKEGWAFRQRYMKWKEGTEIPPQPHKKATASCAADGYYYSHFYNGHIVKIHPKTYESETIFVVPSQGECYGLAFHPKKPTMLYMSSYSNAGTLANSISCFDVTDPAGTFQKLTGATNGGHRDGELALSQFSNPAQLFFDPDGNLYIADSGNHCIRRINTETNMVETVVGIPKTAGWKDGGKDEALFNGPWGITVSSDGTVYVGDTGNSRIRKLAIE